MVDAAPDPREIYRDILLPAGQGINARPDINIDAVKLRETFNRAARGEDVVDTALINGLTGGITNLYRSNPNDMTLYDFKADIEPVMRFARIESQRPLTVAESRQFDESITAMAASTGLKENLIRAQLPGIEDAYRTRDQKLFSEFSIGGPGASDIGAAIAKRVREGSLPPADEQKLNQDLAAYAKANSFHPDVMQGMITGYESNVRDTDSKVLEAFTKAENDFAAATHIGGSAYMDVPALADDNIVVTRHGPEDAIAVIQRGPEEFARIMAFVAQHGPEEFARLKAFGFEENDMPSRAPPFTSEQSYFLAALHESEHAMNKPGRSLVVPEGYDPKLVGQAKEIDADTAVIKFLNDTDDTAGKEYWLQWRSAQSFNDGVRGNFDHDTATFLRVQEQTGQQIDLGQYRREKEGLATRIRDKFDLSAVDAGKIRNGNIMAAVDEILKDDREHPEKKLLTPLQRAEAAQYLADASALGFSADPNYPKPSPEAPAPSSPPQAPRLQVF